MKNWSRKRKLVLCFLILLSSLAIIFSISGWPSPTPEIALRRMEKRKLIGPTQIIASMDFEHAPYDHLMIGKSQYGYTTFEYSESTGWDNGVLSYYPKTDGATLFCTYYPYGTGSGDPWLPIFLFPEGRLGSEAKMTLSISINGTTETYQLSAERENSSYYLFSLPIDHLEGKFFWLLQQAITGNYSEYILSGTVDIQIDFFNSSGDIVNTYTQTVTK